MLKAITLYEPYASLMAIGAKRNETRGCRTSHRGDIAIHAAKADHGTPETLVPLILQAIESRRDQLQGWRPDPVYLGCIIAVVNLYDVQPAERVYPTSSAEELAFGNYLCGRWIYLTHTVRRLAKPVPCRGSQAIGWTVPANVEALVRAQLPKVLPLECCCCGQPAPAFTQWWNRDTGYGICAACFRRCLKTETNHEEVLRRYGRPGVHHSI